MRSTLRICASVFGLMLATATASLGSDHDYRAARDSNAPELAPVESSATPAACCMICTKGKACGNSCIAREKNCQPSATRLRSGDG